MYSKVLLENLNEAQRACVLHGEGPALIAAGPGSGKTFTITRRLLYLILEKKVLPQNILVITFTREAAKSMQERFLEQLREQNIYLNDGFVSFGTFHSYFYQILKSIKKYSEYQLITQQEKQKIAAIVLKKFAQEEVSELSVRQFLTQISYFKNTGKRKNSKGEQEENNIFFEKLKEYERLEKRYRRLDFDDMLYLCQKELLENQKLLNDWQDRFEYLLIDEFQDIGPVQYDIIKMLCKSPYNLFAVGDDDQSIYGFRGSDSRSFQRFLKDYPNAVQLQLATNYRCCENIVKASRRLIEKNRNRVVKELAACRENASKGQIRLVASIHARQSYEKLAVFLKEKALDELQQEAVLFRTNFAMQLFAGELSRYHIPFVLREKCESVYNHFLLKDISDYFQAACGSCERAIYLRIFQKQGIYQGREVLENGLVDLEKVKILYKQGFYENCRALEQVEALERHLQRLRCMRPKLGISYILHAMGYEAYLIRKAGEEKNVLEEWKQILEWLMEDAASYADFRSWQEHQEICRRELEQEQKAEPKKKKGVHLLTLHASKGLEFEKVYIMNLNEGELPKYGRGEVMTKEQEEEERRLFYVGMTRAKKVLELHYAVGTKEKPRIRSRFLEEIGNA